MILFVLSVRFIASLAWIRTFRCQIAAATLMSEFPQRQYVHNLNKTGTVNVVSSSWVIMS